MTRRRLARARAAVLELDVVDLVLVLSVVQYAYDVRELVRGRIRNRRRLVDLTGGGRGEPIASDAPAPDYATENERLAVDLLEPLVDAGGREDPL